MRKQIVLLFLVGFFISNGQEVVLNENLNVLETELYVEIFSCLNRYERHPVYYSRDYKVFESNAIAFITRGLSVFALQLIFKHDSVYPEFILVSDYDEFSGAHQMNLTLYDFKIVVNKLNFKTGDVIQGTLYASATVMINECIRQLNVSGNFRHIIGEVIADNKIDEFLKAMYLKRK